MLKSMESKGLPLIDDLFTTGETPNGCGHAVRTVYKGVRLSGAEYLNGCEDKIDIVSNTMVDKVDLQERDGGLVASSVELVDTEGVKKIVTAKREIIVSGGTYCSPVILMRSGIGSNSELAQHDIDCRVDRPGVGKNLIDHLVRWAPAQRNLGSVNMS
jgi:choline dehydrogenase-like flavoprotein